MSEVTWSSDVDQHVDPSMIIAKRIPKDAARPATLQLIDDHLMRLITSFIAVINPFLWTAQSEASVWELQVQYS